MKVTIAEWGNYITAFKTFVEKLGLEVIPPGKTNPKVIEEGAKLSPDLFCFPLKVNIGNYLSALRKGADTILMWENIGGSCRMRYYWVIQEKILKEAGFDVKVMNFNSKNLIPQANKIRKENGVSLKNFLLASFLALREFKFIEKLDRKAHYLRPRELKQGETDQVLSKIFIGLESVNTLRKLSDLEKEAKGKTSGIKIDPQKKVLKVGIVGEIYTIVDGTVNFGLEKKLGTMGCEVHRKLNLTQHLLGGLLPWREWQLQRKIRPYLKTTVGGHGRQAIEEMLDFAKEGFDGVIQLLPFGCMPEVTVRPILQEISQKHNLPFLSISLDEQTAETGLQTRIEAFTDLLWSKRKNKQANNLNN